MAASDKLSKLKKALEEKKKGSPRAKEAPVLAKVQEKAAARPVEKPAAKAPEKAPARSERKPEPLPARESRKTTLAPALKPEPRPAPKSAPNAPPYAPAKKPAFAAKPDLNKRIIETILDDPRLSNHDQVMRVVIASIARKGEIESKIKSIKDVVNEEIKKLLG